MIDPNFILLDLRSQWDAFVEYAVDWTLPELVDWLAKYGEVIPFSYDRSSGYTFVSSCGLISSLWWIDQDTGLIGPSFPSAKRLHVLSHKD